MRNIKFDALRRAAAPVIALLLLSGCSTLSQESLRDAASPPQKTAEATSDHKFFWRGKKKTAGKPAARQYDDVWARMRAGFELPDYRNHRVAYYEKWYSSRPDYLQRVTDRAQWFLPQILDQLEKRGMPSDLALLPVIESAYRTDARSHASAVGMWQFISVTGKRFGLRQDWWYDGRGDPRQSTRAALDYLEILGDEFDGDWFLALAGYNAGENRVKKERRKNQQRGRATTYHHLNLRKETRDYVPKLLAVRNIVRNPAHFGVKLTPIPNRTMLASVNARTQTDLSVMAKLAGISADRMQFLNNGYKRGVTPPNGPHTVLVPVERHAALTAGLKNISRQDRVRMARYQVRRGDSLSNISRRYGISVATIKKANRLPGNSIHPGQTLLIPAYQGDYRVASARPAKKSRNKSSRKKSGRNKKSGKRWTTHKVKRGDTLWSISRRYGVNVSQLTKWNRIGKSQVLRSGDRLAVYR
ncbi:MAG: LysM peptidoglycan-binding domain-containing protein [Pseudomonadota bacterium]|nr:LysM peptidoglycan-binding domain-containing protein [Pseudomonadota bacterium]